MSKSLLMGVDIGTYESKGVLVSLDGKVIASAVQPHKMLFPKAGWAEHDPELTWWGDFLAISKKLLSTPDVKNSDIKGISVSAIGPDVLPIDENFMPLRMGILYGVDTRAVEEIRELNEKHGSKNIFQATGNALSSQSTGPKVLWIKKNEPEIYSKARWFVDATTFIVARLTNKVVVDHYSAGAQVPFYDPISKSWNPLMCEGILDVSQLPEIHWSDEVIGEISLKAAEQTGLFPGTPVLTGTIDAGAEALSVGVTKPGEMMLMYGSTIYIVQVTDNEDARDERLWASPYLFKGTWCLQAGMATSGALTRWFKDQFAIDLILAEEDGGALAYKVLAESAAGVEPGSEGIIVLPYFSGERTPLNDPLAKGTIFGLNLTHTRAHIYRAVLEGMGYGVKQHVDLFKEMNVTPSIIKSVGGGTKNPAWLQIISNISGVPQEIAPITVGASYGNALLAGIGVGLVSGPEAIREWQEGFRMVTPDPKLTEFYLPLSKIYNELYYATKDLMHRLHKLFN